MRYMPRMYRIRGLYAHRVAQLLMYGPKKLYKCLQFAMPCVACRFSRAASPRRRRLVGLGAAPACRRCGAREALGVLEMRVRP